MRIDCPLCGPRDIREFYYKGAADYLDRPAEDAGPGAWDAHLHLRDNPEGPLDELWYHTAGCTSWLVVTRNTRSHEITAVRAVEDGGRA